jgi:hypothetical protein
MVSDMVRLKPDGAGTRGPMDDRRRKVPVNHQVPTARRVTQDLLPVAGAAQHARNVVTNACIRWNLADLVPSATLIISELVSNAVDHAHTIISVEVCVQDSYLYLGVRDGGGARPAVRHTDDADTRGRGLRLVAAFSSDWGYITDAYGKTVWATLALPHP